MTAAARPRNRLVIIAAATLLQICLGTMYGWSLFQVLLIREFHWTHAAATGVFSLEIFVFGFSCAFSGYNLKRVGPRKFAITGGILFSLSYLTSALALHLNNVPLFYLCYSVLGGIGSGFAYVTPVSTVAKWFPDSKGPATAVVLMGFGFGAFALSKLVAAPLLSVTHGNLELVFLLIGLLLVLVLIPVTLMLHEAPAGFYPGQPPAKTLAAPQASTAGTPAVTESALGYLLSLQFITLWLVFFFMTGAGIAVISFQSGLLQQIWSRAEPTCGAAVLAVYGANLIAVSSLFNAIGRIAWATASVRIGRIGAFRTMIATQLLTFGLMLTVHNPWVFAGLVCYVLFCFGGAFGTLPAIVLDLYGLERTPVVFGALLTAFSAAGIGGPMLVAVLQDAYPDRALTYAFTIAVVGLASSFIASFLLINRRFRVGKPLLTDLGIAGA